MELHFLCFFFLLKSVFVLLWGGGGGGSVSSLSTGLFLQSESVSAILSMISAAIIINSLIWCQHSLLHSPDVHEPSLWRHPCVHDDTHERMFSHSGLSQLYV